MREARLLAVLMAFSGGRSTVGAEGGGEDAEESEVRLIDEAEERASSRTEGVGVDSADAGVDEARGEVAGVGGTTARRFEGSSYSSNRQAGDTE